MKAAILTLICCLALWSAPAPRDGWTYVPGAQNLVQAGQWGCTNGVGATDAALTIIGGSGYNTAISTSGPILQVSGDFSVLATLQLKAGTSAFVTLVGTLSDGSQWWSGLKRLDVGLDSGSILVNYWTGTSSNATSQTFAFSGSANEVDLEIARAGDQLVIYANGANVGTISDPGLFSSGRLYFGFNSPPNTTLVVPVLAAAMPTGGATVLSAPYLQSVARTGTALRDVADRSGFLVGAAIDPSHFTESGYAQAAGREFNLMVAENAMKFGPTEPGRGTFNFCAADQIVSFAQANGIKVRGHTLVWHQSLPSWLTNGNFSKDDAASILQNHIRNVLGHFKGKIIEWDVVNEAITYGPPYVSMPSYWLTQLGSNYVDLAFQWAHEADPDLKLFYNDTGGEGLGAKSDTVYNLVKGMVSRGVPVNGVGLQMHVSATNAPSIADIQANLARFAALGLEVHITEMDVRIPMDSSGNSSAADLAAQAQVYKNVTTACRGASNCTGIVTWGVSDLYSWIPGQYPGFGNALLLDRKYQGKSAYDALKSVLDSTTLASQPVIATGGVVIHGGTATRLSPGSLVDIYGINLAPAAVTASALPLPAVLGDVQVMVNGKAAPVYYVSPGLVIFQLPYETGTGSVLVQVKSPAGASSSGAVTVEKAAPSILVYGNNRAVAQNEDYSVNSVTNCAKPGSYLTVYMMGSGPLNNIPVTGAATPATPLAAESLPTTAMIGGSAANVAFAGLTPGSIGLMQVNVQVPAGVFGDLPLRIQVGTYGTNEPLVCVAKP